MTRGGLGASVALALRRSGHQVHYIGAAGDDPARQVFQLAMNAAGIALQLRIVDRPTGTVVALVAHDGQRMMLTDRGANASLDQASVDEFLQHPYDHLHVSGYLLLDSATRSVAEHALRKAQQFGSSTSIDVCSVAPLRAVTPEVFLQGRRATRRRSSRTKKRPWCSRAPSTQPRRWRVCRGPSMK